jgi:hypothetical protein
VVSRNCGGSWNVLPVDTGAQLYICLSPHPVVLLHIYWSKEFMYTCMYVCTYVQPYISNFISSLSYRCAVEFYTFSEHPVLFVTEAVCAMCKWWNTSAVGNEADEQYVQLHYDAKWCLVCSVTCVIMWRQHVLSGCMVLNITTYRGNIQQLLLLIVLWSLQFIFGNFNKSAPSYQKTYRFSITKSKQFAVWENNCCWLWRYVLTYIHT